MVNMYRETFILLFCVFVGVQSILEFENEKCHRDDRACITRLANSLLDMAIKGDPSLHMENLDPMSQDTIEGTFIIARYKLYNSTVVGFKDCRVADTRLSMENSTMRFKMYCPALTMFGLYEISGRLIVVPIEGNGEYRLDTKDYYVYVETTTQITEDQFGQRYMYYKNFKAVGDLKGGMVADLTNLFNGQNKELASAALKFANEQWRPVSKEFQGPVVTANVKKIIKNMNKYLKITPLNKFITY